MKILLDPQIFNQQKYGGISRYYTEIFSSIAKEKNIQIKLPLFCSYNVYLQESCLYGKKQKRISYFLNIFSKLGISLRNIIKINNKNEVLKAMIKQDFDLFIATYYEPYFLEYIKEKPFVLTVYDMIHELFPQYFEGDSTTIANKLLLMEKASKIIAVSENTKKDIITFYPHIDASKIEVIYHGNSIKVNNGIHVDLPANYILFVGVRTGYKNFIFLVNSIKELLKNDTSLHLVCAGGGAFYKQEVELIRELGLENQILFRSFSEKELGQYYKNAICFVFPSMYEGFGIPVLEAMACGCPIVLTNNSSFPEVAGEAGIYFELNNSESLSLKINMLLKNNDLRKEYSLKGFERIKKFDWENAAQSCLKLYYNSLTH